MLCVVVFLLQLEISGCTPLTLACMNGHELVVKMLIDAGARMDNVDCVYPPLHSACFAGEVTVVKMLVLAGANINMMDRAGETALHYAAFRGFEDIVQLLLSRGAALDLPDKQGRLPFHLAKTEDLREMLYFEQEAVEVEDGVEDIEYLNNAPPAEASPLQLQRFDTGTTTF